jgi:hypothetical protein
MATKKKTDDVEFSGVPGDTQVVPDLTKTRGFPVGVVVSTVSLKDGELGTVRDHIFIGDPKPSIAALNYPVVEFDERIALETGELNGFASIVYMVEFDAKRQATPSKVVVFGQDDQLLPEYRTAIRRAFLSDLASCVKGYVIDLTKKPEKKAPAEKAATEPTKANASTPASSAAKKAPAKKAPASKAPASKAKPATPTTSASKKSPVKKTAASKAAKPSTPTASAASRKRVQRTPAKAKPASTTPTQSVTAD